jgi:hypothetical protein
MAKAVISNIHMKYTTHFIKELCRGMPTLNLAKRD